MRTPIRKKQMLLQVSLPTSPPPPPPPPQRPPSSAAAHQAHGRAAGGRRDAAAGGRYGGAEVVGHGRQVAAGIPGQVLTQIWVK